MHVYKKFKNEKENFNPARENYNRSNGGYKCPIWIFVIMGLIALLVMIWLIICIIKDKKSKNSSFS
jgi:heme/copper-type cytochrome/quinol oxidase subunit 2